VQARQSRVARPALPDQDAPEIRAALKDLPDWIGRTRTVCPVGEDGEITNGLHYSSRFGVAFQSDSE